MAFTNVYEDTTRAEAYAALEFPGTYYLAYRDLPEIIARHVTGRNALDFGCGAGRSTRFLKQLGFNTIGVDISSRMLDLARQFDPDGTYQRVDDGDFGALDSSRFDLILSAFAFDNIPTVERRTALVRGMAGLLHDEGRMILLGSSSDIYLHDWTSFTTADFPENRVARSGDTVRIVMKDVTDRRPVIDVLWFHEDYLQLFAASGLELEAHYAPLGRDDEPFEWLAETSISPWFIYVLKKLS